MSTTSTRRVALAAVTAALAASGTAQAAPAFDAGVSDAAQGNATATREYRSLDGAVAYTDLRSEAARSAGQPRPSVVVDVGSPQGQGLDWTAVGIGAGGGIAIAAISAAGLLATRRPRPSRVVL